MSREDWAGQRIVIVGLARQGIALARFFCAQGARVRVTDLRTASALRAEVAALEDLAQTGMGRWENAPIGPKGGRPTRRFVLTDAFDGDKTLSEPEGNRGSVNVNTVDAVENGAQVNDLLAEAASEDANDWGAI